MSTPYRNNLELGDTVMHVETKRVGKITAQPRETSRTSPVQWQGSNSAQYVDIMKLRLVVNGQPEDVPPCDGEPPSGKAAVETVAADDPLASLRRSQAEIKTEKEKLNARFKELSIKEQKVDAAIAALS